MTAMLATRTAERRAPRIVRLAAPDDFDGWREAARSLALIGAAPDEIAWAVGSERELFAAPAPAPPAAPGLFSVPRAFVGLARNVILHRDPERFSLLYIFLCRLREQPRAMEDGADPLLRRLERMAMAVRRDMHRMRAELRFRGVEEPGGPRLVAWFDPEHHILRASAGFFTRRYADRRWSILTPELSLHWDGERLSEGAGVAEADVPRGAERGDNARKAWMAVRDEAAGCTRCPLYRDATQTVFGEGPLDARIMFVGEQPGDQEDVQGRPFVGPAGLIFDRAMRDAGVDRARTYVTNAVKHFKFELRGKRRLHQKPDGGEIQACRWWLERERQIIRPPITVALGATAARSLFGKTVTIAKMRGRPHHIADGGETWVTVHPSFLLRVRDNREEEYERFVNDLKRIGERAKALAD